MRKLVIDLSELDYEIKGNVEVETDIIDTHVGDKVEKHITEESEINLIVNKDSIIEAQIEAIRECDDVIESVSFEYQFEGVYYSKFGDIEVTLSEPTKYKIENNKAVFRLDF